MKKLSQTLLLMQLFTAAQSFSQGSLSLFIKDGVTGYGTKAEIIFQGPDNSKTMETDGGGILLFTSTPGRYELFVYAKGYKSLVTWFMLEEGKTLDVEIILDRENYSPPVFENNRGMSVVESYVVDNSTGKPLEGVDIKITRMKKNIKTDQNGYFYVETPYYSTMRENDEEPVRTDFIFTKPGYKTNIEKDVLLLPGKQTMKITLKKGNGEVVNKHIQSIIDGGEHQKSPSYEENKSEKEKTPGNLKKKSDDGHPDKSGQKTGVSGGRNNLSSHCTPPSSIRVGTNCSCTSCSEVSVMSLENYVEAGLDNEWISSWHSNSLRAGAVSYRTYGVWHVLNPINANYDICSSTCCQAYSSDVFASTQDAAIFTAGILLEKNNAVARSEYSAENNNSGVCSWANCLTGGNPCGDGFSGSDSYPCISDAVCTGESCCGHGRGMCQWGSQRWANNNGQTWTWILDHYYNPDSTFRCPSFICEDFLTVSLHATSGDHHYFASNAIKLYNSKISSSAKVILHANRFAISNTTLKSSLKTLIDPCTATANKTNLTNTVSEDSIINNEDRASQSQFEVYPNPFKDELTFSGNYYSSDAPINLNIYNVYGEVVIQKRIDDINNDKPVFTISTKSISAGIYVCTLLCQGEVLIRKKIIKIN